MLAEALSLDLDDEKSLVKRLFEVSEPLLIEFDFATKVVNSYISLIKKREQDY